MAKYRKEELTATNLNIGLVPRREEVAIESPQKIRPTTANSLPQSVPEANVKKRQEATESVCSEQRQSW
jgi:hypothetical protein